MRLFFLFSIAIITLVQAASIPLKDMTDFEIAKMFVDNAQQTGRTSLLYSATTPNIHNTAVADDLVVYPTENTTWYVGELVNVTYECVKDSSETVSIFFFDKTVLLAGGPLTKKTFPFVVPVEAVSPTDGTSLLLSVRRKNFYLQTVDSIVVKVLPGKPE